MNQKELTKELIAASDAYYNTGSAVMSDLEFDRKVEELRAMETESGVILPGSPTQSVGAKVDGLKKVSHEQPALSLDKVKYKDRESLKKWLGNRQAVLSWKCDGNTLVVSYDNGMLTSAVTRGDGTEGSDVTHNAHFFKGIPQKIPYAGHLVVRGEAMMTYAEFERVNSEANGIYENPRNLAAATIQMLDAEESRKREIIFRAFELVTPEPVTGQFVPDPKSAFPADGFNLQYMQDRLDWLQSLGFDVVDRECCDASDILQKIEEWKEDVQNLAYPTDGLVISYQDLVEGWALGSTGHHPRWAMALKWTDETYTTTIRDIEWSVGKTGIITPVAVFDEVRMGLGSNVTRASLHNISIMENMPTPDGKREPVRLGCKAEVYLANMIIPQIANIQNSFDGGKTCPTIPVQIPDVCPVCGSKTEIRENNGIKVLYCTNSECPAQQIGKLMNTFSKDGLFVKGLGESQIEDLLNARLVTADPESFYYMAGVWDFMHSEDYLQNDHDETFKEAVYELLDKDGWGQKKWDNLIDAINVSRETTLQKFLYSLNIPLMGNDLSKKLAKFWNNDIKKFVGFVQLAGSGSHEDPYSGKDEAYSVLINIDGIGEEKARNIVDWAEETTAYREKWEDFMSLVKELNFPKTELQEIAEAVNMDEFEPVDTEGHTMEGTVTYKDRKFFVHVSFYDSAKTWEEAVAKDVLRQMKEDSGTSSLEGLTFVITGSVHQYKNRDEFKASVEARGGKVAGSVSKNTAALICNEKSSSNKSKKAAELSVPVLTEDEFIAKYGK